MRTTLFIASIYGAMAAIAYLFAAIDLFDFLKDFENALAANVVGALIFLPFILVAIFVLYFIFYPND
jgi:hypothetical protein